MKKLLPPQLLYITIAVMTVLHFFFPVWKLIEYPYYIFGITIFLIGLAISWIGSKKFEKVGTNIKTFKEPDILVADGIFGISRNPMYLGFVILLIGIAVIMGTLSPWIMVLFYFTAVDLWYIPFEEKCCEDIFGKLYLVYKSSVRRWI